MFELVSMFLQNVVLTVIVFLGLFFGLAYAFARERFFQLIVGVFRTVVSFFVSPFVYMKSTALAIADFGQRGDAQFQASDQYLLNKALIALRASLIVGAILALAVTIAAGFEGSLPSKAVRMAISNLEEQLDKHRADLMATRARLDHMETEWQSRRQSLIEQYKNERLQKSKTATDENAQIESTLRSDSTATTALDSIKSYLAQNLSVSNEAGFARIRESADQFIGRLSISDAAHQQILRYVDNWKTQRIAATELASMSEADLRARIQPEYGLVKGQVDLLEGRVREESETLTSLRQQLQYHPEVLAIALVTGFLGFVFTVWGVGLLIEAISLAVFVAGDVKKIRMAAERPPAQTRVAAAGPVGPEPSPGR